MRFAPVRAHDESQAKSPSSVRKRLARFLDAWDRTDELTETKRAVFLGDAVELIRDCLDILVKIA